MECNILFRLQYKIIHPGLFLNDYFLTKTLQLNDFIIIISRITRNSSIAGVSISNCSISIELYFLQAALFRISEGIIC